MPGSILRGGDLPDRFSDRTAVVGVIGLGYVGLPLALESARAGFRTIGFDISQRVVDGVTAGKSHIQDVPGDALAAFVGEGLISATSEMARLAECDAISICVPTPLSKTKDPDTSYIAAATKVLRDALRPGQLIILESTTYPGTTRELMLPVLEETGLKAGRDFFLCFSPERVDPGNRTWQTKNTPKVLGGITPLCGRVGQALYSRIFDTVVPVSSTEAAELVKLHENTFRMINIALANELAQMCDRLGVEVWEVIEAAGTKPFGFMKFAPGPGLGGHCIPLDPHYLSWKMRTLDYRTRMIEVSSEINAEMPAYVVRKTQDALNDHAKSLRGSRILVCGVAYKKDIDDLRESPALDIIKLLEGQGAEVRYHDPYVASFTEDGHAHASVPLTPESVAAVDCVMVVTDHTGLDYAMIKRHAKSVVDTRNALAKVG